jgi:hypothetical protein
LKELHLLEAAYPETDDELYFCEERIAITLDEVYKSFEKKTRAQPDYEAFAPCITEDLKSKRWVEGMMLNFVYEASESLTQSEKNLKTAPIKVKSYKDAKLALTNCASKEAFLNLFDNIFEEVPVPNQENPIEDYCDRKYVVDNNLIDTTKFNFSVNPNNLDVSNVDCEPHIKKSLTKLDATMLIRLKSVGNFNFEDREINCALEQYHADNLRDQFFRLPALREIHLTDKEKAVEKKNFIKTMSEMVFLVNECKKKQN